MAAKKRIGVFAPPRDNTGFRAYQGVFPPDVLKEFTHTLQRDPDIEYVSIDLTRAFIKNGHVYVGDECLSGLDLFFWFYILPVGHHDYDLQRLKTLAAHTRVIPNPFGVEHGVDKFASQTLLNRHSIATPEFCLFSSDRVAEMTGLLDAWGSVLLKPRLGSFGHGITKISTKQQLIDTVQYAASFRREPISIFCERFEPHAIGKWISATVINGEVVFGYRKRVTRFVEGWKVYDPDMIGGEADYVDPAPVADIAAAAADALKTDIIGFDFIFSERLGEYLIVDANTVPGMYPECFLRAGTKTWASYFADMIRSHL